MKRQLFKPSFFVILISLFYFFSGFLSNLSSAENDSTDHSAETINADWAREVPSKPLSTPYTTEEKWQWLKNNLFGPSTEYKELSQFIPHTTTLNKITPKLSIGFFGDIMQMKGMKLTFDEELKQFFANVDYLVGNFEGVITSKKGVLLGSVPTEETLLQLKELFPAERFIMTNSNNHSCDFGWKGFNRSYQLQKKHGFLVIGRKDQPSILLDTKVNLANVTQWSNQPCTHISRFEDIEAAYNPDAAMNILVPHWGYEMQLYPNPKQIRLAKGLLNQWDLIAGHHSHSPQIVTAYNIGDTEKLTAYSLGDFNTHLTHHKYRYGIVLIAELGPAADGKWKVGKVDWQFTFVNHLDDDTVRIELVESYAPFDVP